MLNQTLSVTCVGVHTCIGESARREAHPALRAARPPNAPATALATTAPLAAHSPMVSVADCCTLHHSLLDKLVPRVFALVFGETVCGARLKWPQPVVNKRKLT